MISFVRTGREEVGLTAAGCVSAATGSWFVGWLDEVLTTLARSCAVAAPEKTATANKAHTDRNRLFLKNIKSKTPINFFARETWEVAVNCSPIYKKQTTHKQFLKFKGISKTNSNCDPCLNLETN